jgi:hypothetical protein
MAVPVVRAGTVAATGINPGAAGPAVTAADFGGIQGQALSQAGATVAGAGDTMQKTALRMEAEDNETAAKTADTAFNGALRGVLFDPEKGYLNTKGKTAVDGYKATMEAVQKVQDDAAAAIKNPAARKLFADIADRRRDAALDTMAKHASIERRTYLDGASIARAMDAGDDAIAYAPDPVKREAFLNVGRTEIATFAADHGEPAEVTQRKLRDYDTKAYSGIVQRMAITDPLGAQTFYEANKHKIDGTQQIGLEKFLKESTGRRQATNDADSVMGFNVGGDYGSKAGATENGGNYGGTPNASTNAGGKYQFKDDTFLSVARKADPALTAGKTDAELLALKKSDTPEGRKLQDAAMTQFTKDNEGVLTANGIKITDASRHLAHWFGAAGAVAVIKADPATPSSAFFKSGKGADGKIRTAEQWAAENGLAGKTAGDIVTMTRKKMGDVATALPGEAAVSTSTDAKSVARDFEANLSNYIEQAKKLYGNDPERMDKALTEIKNRAALQELGVKAKEKADTDTAWKIAVTPGPGGLKPTTQDAIPPDVWVRLDPLHQRALQAQFAHNAKGTEPPANYGLYYALNREAQDDPDKFKARNLFLNKKDLPEKQWNPLVDLQRSIVKGDAKEYKITEAMHVAQVPLREAGFDLGATASKKDQEVLGQFQAALQNWVTRYQEVNKKPPQQKDVLAQVDHMLIQGRLHGDGIFGGDGWRWSAPKQVEGPKGQKGTRGSQPGTTFNFQVPPSARGSAAPNSFYVPYDQIPAADRVEAEQWMVNKKLIPPRFAPPSALPVTGNIPASDRERRKLIEDAHANYLAGGGNWRDGK